jgi:hypothetical protein
MQSVVGNSVVIAAKYRQMRKRAQMRKKCLDKLAFSYIIGVHRRKAY